ncbi:hypothetical protein JCM11641_003973 [Rhodosporidiobolus odoratus]
MTQIYHTHTPVPPHPQLNQEEQLDSAISLAQELFEHPVVNGARFLPTGNPGNELSTLQLNTSSRSLSALNKRNATQSLILADDNSVVAASPSVFTSEEVKHTAISPDGKRQAVFRVSAAKEGKEQKRMIEVLDVSSGWKESEIEVTKENGDFYFDGTFGLPSWHPSSLALVYTAEAPPSKPDPKATRPSQQKFHWEPDFGETFIGKREPTLFLLVLPGSPLNSLVAAKKELDKPTVHRLIVPETVPGTYFGQPTFLPTPSEEQVVLAATGYSTLADGRKLGIVYCCNRSARIYALSLDVEEEKAEPEVEGRNEDKLRKVFRIAKATPISAKDRSSRSPRVVSGSSSLVYLSNPLGGPHASCGQLHIASLSLSLSTSSSSSLTLVKVKLKEDKILVSVVNVPDPKTPGPGSPSDPFPGLYVDQLPQEPCLSGGQSVVMTSIWRSRRVPLVVDLASGKVTSLAPWPEKKDEVDAALPYLYLLNEESDQDALASVAVIGTDGESRVVALRSSPVSPPKVVVGKVEGGKVEWKVVRESGLSGKLSDALSCLSYTVLPLPKFAPTELILVSPNSIDPTAPSRPNLPPLINQPHGGPHSTACTEWNYSAAASVLAGYRFCHVNYPGSLGFGQHAVDVLPPRLGELEVEATLAAPHYLNSLSLASRTKGKKLLMGGSHGGWTACHLTARFPSEYDAVVMRNPVTDLVGNAAVTDIPDWCFAEGDLPYPFSSPPTYLTPSTYEKMHSISPLRYATSVRTPTLLLIGAEDRRVPPPQGKAWYHALKQAGTEVEMLMFPGNGHPIAETVESEWVAWESGLRWLARFTDFS